MAQQASQIAAKIEEDADFPRFRAAFLEQALDHEEGELPLAVLEALAREFWTFAAQRGTGETKLRLHVHEASAQRFSVLEIVTDDRPFLVASVLAELAQFDATITWVGHPIVAVERDAAGRRKRLVATLKEVRALTHASGVLRESMIQIAFERPIDLATSTAIQSRLQKVLSDVALIVSDWKAMLARLDETIAELDRAKAHYSGEEADEIGEAAAFLAWLKSDHFVFIGCRDYDRAGAGRAELVPEESTSLGLLRDPSARILRRDGNNEALSPALEAFFSAPSPIIITKGNFRSSVHRRVYLDYIGVKRFSDAGEAIGERRFLGLFTSAAYNRMPQDIPILRRKVRRVLERANFSRASYNYNKLSNILETYPRDELFQIDENELFEIALGIVRLTERPRTRLFVRPDKFDRFVSAMVFVPRERYTAELRERIGDILKDAYDGRVSAFYPLLGDSALVRVHFIIGRNPGARPLVDVHEVEARIIAAAQSWREGLHEALTETRGEDEAHRILERYGDAFSLVYREEFTARDALADIARLERLGPFPDVGIRAYRRPKDDERTLHIKLYRRGEPIVLSKSLPIFEHLGLSVVDEFSYQVTPGLLSGARDVIYLHDLTLTYQSGPMPELATIAGAIESAFPAIWLGLAEDDRFNALILTSGLPWREVAILRALARYLVQTGSSLSQLYMEEALSANPNIVRLLLDLFRTRLDPAGPGGRGADGEEIESEILKALEGVQSLDQDRILRRFLNLVQSILRTNYYQRTEDGAPRATLSFKFDSRKLEGLPEPKPLVEIFVYAPRFEGVHLRFGPVARGGIRWSDRREDFRTEILGLVKAQYVKNAVIVPVGAKGGFVPKRIAADATREAVQAEGVACYKLFIESLLDLTDNLHIHRMNAPPIRPANTFCHDGPDPYLVVAADKGTASFSDIANAIAIQKQFWLGDAFASGGSNGYDHKAIAITARGAWEAVKRHFREMGKDIQSEPFTVIGIGDMSGDVFGNGMLLSREIRLLAAFDHRDIFIDPAPDPASSYEERARLYALPRSSWQDYDKKLISKGGGVFSRKLKSIAVTREMQEMFGVAEKTLAPADLIRALLRAQVDLLWFGGIGTYVKAREERNGDVGDTANDALRVDGEDLRAKVVGEGANLGCTQLGRIAYALKGGRINTDAIDNSAGVDCSDHEVNIKILLDSAVAQGKLEEKKRNAILKELTDDVAAHVLKDNYDQTLALSLAEATARDDFDSHGRLIRALEREGRLKRDVERLPSEDEMQERKAAGLGLTRPEIAILLAYCKLKSFDDLVASEVPDDPALHHDLVSYFPGDLAERFPEQLKAHRLRREIIATSLANEMANIGGVNYATRLNELSGADIAEVAHAYAVVRDVFEIVKLRALINALDGKIETGVQTGMHTALRTFLRRQSIWFLRRGEQSHAGILAMSKRYKPPIGALRAQLKELSSAFVREGIEKDEVQLVAQGVPAETAFAVASFEPLFGAGDVVYLALDSNIDVETAARANALIGEATGLERLLPKAVHLTSKDHWERLAIRRIVEDLTQQQAVLASVALNPTAQAPDGVEAVGAWLLANAPEVKRMSAALDELESGGGITAAKLSLAVGYIRDLVVYARTQQKA